MSVPTAYQGQVMLAGWSETHDGGAKVTFWLPDATDLDAFRTMTVRKGKTAGQRLAMVLVLIGDDEQPVPVEPEKAPTNPKGGPLAQLAGRWCADPAFQQWVHEVHPHMFPGLTDFQEYARRVIVLTCGIQSRAELDHSEEAAERFHRCIRIPYSRYIGGDA